VDSFAPNAHAIHVAQVCERLSHAYGNPRHGNRQNPLDELVLIILSTRTREARYADTYLSLKREFPSWDGLRARHRKQVRQILAPGGLAGVKTEQLLAIIRTLRRVFGHATLTPLTHLPDDEVEQFLTSLPGVGKKVAKCVMMYSMDRQVLPVDVHVHRVAQRLGMATKRRPDTSQDLIEAAIPPTFRYGFHVNAVAHGRAVCTPRRPECPRCLLRRYCTYYRRNRARVRG